MQQAGKILIKNLKPLIAGRSSTFGSSLAQTFVKKGATIFSIDKRIPDNVTNKEKFLQGDLTDESFFQNYLNKLDPVDSFINCAAIKKSYNYYLSYLLSRNILEKFKENDINQYGCRGCIINLVYSASEYDDKYFSEQDAFAKKFKIDTEKIDDQVFELADRLTAARIRCNTILVNEQTDIATFSNLVNHILEDQYVAGQLINTEDNLKHKTPTFKEIFTDHFTPPEHVTNQEKYVPPKELNATSTPTLPPPKDIV